MKEDQFYKEIGVRETGMKTPEHYFEDFSVRMEQLIDADSTPKTEVKSVRRIFLRPKSTSWIYMAAMLTAFIVLFRIFILPISNPVSHQMVSENKEEVLSFDDALLASMNDYDFYEYLYNDSEN